MTKRLDLNPDRAFPAESATRSIARMIYAEVRALPLFCMHGHVDPAQLADDRPFSDPASLLVTPDHYVTRMIASQGVPLGALGVPRVDGEATEHDSRAIWRTFCAHWHLFRGTPSRYWLEHELAAVLGVSLAPSPETADALYDEISAKLAEPQFRPQALLDRFDIEVLATTDSALSPLTDHAKLAADGWADRVVPTFRPDELFHPEDSAWPQAIAELGDLTDVDTSTYNGFVDAIRRRREVFVAAGARATDHGHPGADSAPMSDSSAQRAYSHFVEGDVEHHESVAFASHMLHAMAEMSCDDGLVMQLHPGVIRDHDRGTRATYGSNQGYDIPIAVEFTRSLRPILESFGHHPRFRLIVYTVDETTYSRELGPLAGVYPAMRLGAPWWFLDTPDGMRRFRESVTDTAGFYNVSGFVDDTRAFASIPARHDLARRIDAGFLARLVAEHRLGLDEAIETAVDLAYNLPKDSYQVQVRP